MLFRKERYSPAKGFAPPVVDFHIFPDGAHQIEPTVQSHQTGALDVIVHPWEKKGFLEFEPLRTSSGQAHAAALADQPLGRSRTDQQPILPLMPEQIGIPETDPVPFRLVCGLIVEAPRREREVQLVVLPPAIQVSGDGAADALDVAALGPVQARVEHLEDPAFRIPGDMHRPQHVVIPGAGFSGEEGVPGAPPAHAVVGDGMSDVVMVGQHQMKEVVELPAADHIDVADLPLPEPP